MLTPITKTQAAIRTVSFSSKQGNTFIADLLLIIVIAFMFSFNGAFAAGSVSSKEEKQAQLIPKNITKQLNLLKLITLKTL